MRLITRCNHCGQLATPTRAGLRAAWPQMAFAACQGPSFPVGVPLRDKRGRVSRGSGPVRSPPTERPARTRRPRIGSLLGGLALLLLLVQLAWWARGELIQSSTARPLLEGLCQALGCRVPLPRLPAELLVLDRELGPHSGQAKHWQLRLGLRNHATVPQALPVIELEFYDLREQLTAVGRFPPEQYALPGLPEAIMPGGTVSISLEMGAPDPEPSGFRLRLL